MPDQPLRCERQTGRRGRRQRQGQQSGYDPSNGGADRPPDGALDVLDRMRRSGSRRRCRLPPQHHLRESGRAGHPVSDVEFM